MSSVIKKLFPAPDTSALQKAQAQQQEKIDQQEADVERRESALKRLRSGRRLSLSSEGSGLASLLAG